MRCKIHQTIPFPKEGLTVGRGSTEAGPGAGGPHVPAARMRFLTFPYSQHIKESAGNRKKREI